MKILFITLSLISSLYSDIYIATGGQNGTYIQIGKNIQKECGKEYSKIEKRKGFTVLPSLGSVDNYNKLILHKADFGLVQYDFLVYAKMNNYPNIENIKMVYPLYNEELHIIVRKDANINSLNDLYGKRVIVGSKNSGSWITSNLIKIITNIKWQDIEISGKKGIDYLNDNKADAMIYVAGRPAKLLTFAKKSFFGFSYSNLKLLSFRDEKLSQIYQSTVIPENSYDIADYSVNTYAIKSVLVTSDYVKYNDVKILSQCIDEKLPALIANGHKKWKEVKIDINNDLKWEYHKATLDYIDTKENKKVNLLNYFKGGTLKSNIPQRDIELQERIDEDSKRLANKLREEKIRKLREFEQNIDLLIVKDLKSLDGYLESEIIKNFYNDSKIIKKLNRCWENEKTDLVKGNIQTRLYTTKCYKEYKKDFYSIVSKNSIDKLIKNIDSYLVKKYNTMIIKKSKILDIDSNVYTKKTLYYNLDTIPNANRNYNNYITNLNSNWNEVIKNMNLYDESFGYLDNAATILESVMSAGNSTRKQALIDKSESLKNIYNITRSFANDLTEDIKEKYNEDVKLSLENIYIEDY